jgi:hypothetical protein
MSIDEKRDLTAAECDELAEALREDAAALPDELERANLLELADCYCDLAQMKRWYRATLQGKRPATGADEGGVLTCPMSLSPSAPSQRTRIPHGNDHNRASRRSDQH